MRSKIISNVVLIALVSQVGLGTGCAWWHRHFGPQTNAGYTAPGGGPGGVTPTDIHTGPMGSRPDIDPDALANSPYAPVYFDYDSATIKPSEFDKVEKVAAALKGTSGKLVIAGNTDERGTAEYNRGLGEKRAEAVRQYLIQRGADGGKIQTVSFGA